MALTGPTLVLKGVGPGGYDPPAVARGANNSAAILLYPSGTGDQLALDTRDSPIEGALFLPTGDTTGRQAVVTGAAAYKYEVGGVLDFVTVHVDVVSGRWDVWIVPFNLPGLATINASVGTVGQGNPAASAASAWYVREADGASVALGATTDAAVTTNTAGTLSAKLRGLVAALADVWDTGNHFLRVRLSDAAGAILGTAAAPVRTDPTGATAQPVTGAFFQATQPVSQSGSPWGANLTQVGGAALSEGQKAMAASVPVVIASDQSALPTIATGADATERRATLVAATAADFAIANAARTGLLLRNRTGGTLYVRLGGVAAVAAYTFTLDDGDTWEPTSRCPTDQVSCYSVGGGVIEGYEV